MLPCWELLVVRNCFVCLDVRWSLKTFWRTLYFQTFVFYLKLVKCFDCFFRCSIVLILKECVALIHSSTLRVFNQVERFKFAETFTQLSDFVILHLEGNASHKNSFVLELHAIFSTSNIEVLKVLFLGPNAECFSSWISATMHIVVPKNRESFAPLNFHAGMLRTWILGTIEIQTNVGIFSLPKL